MYSREKFLEVNDLSVILDENLILDNLNFKVKRGEIHAIMGPNGSGKSTFSKVLAGHPECTTIKGDITYKGKSIMFKEPEERSNDGIFLAFQYPVEVSGVSNQDFLRYAYNSKQLYHGKSIASPLEFLKILEEKMVLINMSPLFLERNLNQGFSGGEKKRNEILQMLLLDPELTVLDETDSGLDIDSLKTIAIGINNHMSKDKAIIIITHYQRLLNYIKPTYVHIMGKSGSIVLSGPSKLAKVLEEKGYAWITS